MPKAVRCLEHHYRENIDERSSRFLFAPAAAGCAPEPHERVIISAYYRAVVLENPKLNYFVMNRKIYQPTTSASPSLS